MTLALKIQKVEFVICVILMQELVGYITLSLVQHQRKLRIIQICEHL